MKKLLILLLLTSASAFANDDFATPDFSNFKEEDCKKSLTIEPDETGVMCEQHMYYCTVNNKVTGWVTIECDFKN